MPIKCDRNGIQCDRETTKECPQCLVRFTRERINEIVNLRDDLQRLMDIFDLGGKLVLDDSNLADPFHGFASLPIDYEDFAFCTTEEDVNDQFWASLKEAVTNKLV